MFKKQLQLLIKLQVSKNIIRVNKFTNKEMFKEVKMYDGKQ